MSPLDLTPFSRDAFERATGEELAAMCERLASALVEMRRRGQSEAAVIEALRGVGHGLWSFDEERGVWCGNWAAPVPGGELIVEGVGDQSCEVSWRARTGDPATDVYSARFDVEDTNDRAPTSAGKPAFEWYLFAAGATRVGMPSGSKNGSDRFAAHSGFAAVADGGGSVSGGALAAEIATDVVISQYRRSAPASCCPSSVAHVRGAPHQGSHESLRDEVRRQLRAAVAATDDAIGAASQLDEVYRGMTTSLCVSLVCQGRLFFAHLGHSRIYHVHAGRVEQLTQDHVLAGHPGVLTHALGCGTTEGLETGVRLVEPGDQVVLASDGLHAHLSPDAILQALDGCDTSRVLECAEALLHSVPASREDATCVVGVIE